MFQNHDYQCGSGPAGYESRSSERLSIPLEATLRLNGGPALPVHIRDISGNGFMAESAETILIGSGVELSLPPIGTLRAEVRWSLAGWVGCKFEDELGWGTLFQKLIGRETAEGAAAGA